MGKTKTIFYYTYRTYFDKIFDFVSRYIVQYNDKNKLVQLPEVVARYQKEVNKFNHKLGETEKIKRFRLVCEEWSPQTGELSPTQKLKRNIVYEKYADIIADIYQHEKKQQTDGKKSRFSVSNITNGIKNTIKKNASE